jgi:hypothetical protein
VWGNLGFCLCGFPAPAANRIFLTSPWSRTEFVFVGSGKKESRSRSRRSRVPGSRGKARAWAGNEVNQGLGGKSALLLLVIKGKLKSGFFAGAFVSKELKNEAWRQDRRPGLTLRALGVRRKIGSYVLAVVKRERIDSGGMMNGQVAHSKAQIQRLYLKKQDYKEMGLAEERRKGMMASCDEQEGPWWWCIFPGRRNRLSSASAPGLGRCRDGSETNTHRHRRCHSSVVQPKRTHQND